MNIYDTYFQHDWNTREGNHTGKLECSCFTTLRLYSQKYKAGVVHRIWNNRIKGKPDRKGFAVVIRQIPFQLKDLEKWDILCRLDTGYDWNETKVILQRLYKDISPETWLNFALFRYLTKAEIQAMTEKLKTETQTELV